MKKLILTLAALISICPVQSFAAFSGSDAGTSTAQFLKLGAGARAAGMGETFAGISDDSTAIYWNPAGLNQIKGPTATLMHAVWFEDINYQWVSYAQPVKNIGVIGIGAQYLSYGSISAIDNTGADAGSFSPNDLAVSLSYARNFKGIDLGANVKYISSQIMNSANAYAADLGAMYKLMNNRLSLGLAVQNIGTAMKFQYQEETLPLNVKIGSAYAIKPQWLVALDINAPIDNAVSFGAGTEYTYKINDTMSVAGRTGYNTRPADTGGLNGFTAGLGFKYLQYAVDYAFLTYGDLGNTQLMSFTMFWGEPRASVKPAEKPVAVVPTIAQAAPAEKLIVAEKPIEKIIEIKEAAKINFERGKSDIREQDKPGLRDVARKIKDMKPLQLRIEAYSDNNGDPGYNRDISQKRAQAVKVFLAGEGVDAGIIIPVGYGEINPIADNSTRAGRAENRRIEFLVITQDAVEVRPVMK